MAIGGSVGKQAADEIVAALPGVEKALSGDVDALVAELRAWREMLANGFSIEVKAKGPQ